MKKALKGLLPPRLRRYLQRHRKRRGFDAPFFIERMLQMHTSNTIPEITVHIDRDRNHFLADLNNLIESLPDNSAFESSRSLLGDLKGDLESNVSLDGFSGDSMEELWLFVVETLRAGDIDRLQEQIVLVLQLCAFSRGNPLDRMSSMKLFNGAWRNGSVEGYPFILMLDSLIGQGLISQTQGKSLYRRTVPPIMRIAGEAYRLGRGRDNSDASELFSFVLGQTFPEPGDTDLRTRWLRIFEGVRQSGVSPSESSYSVPLHDAAERHPEKARYVIVSGMGWSGSGAVYASLREYHAVRAVRAEFQHLSGVASLRSVRQAALNGDSDAVRDELFRLFGLSLFGFGEYSDYQEYRSLVLANRLTVGSDRDGYASGIQHVVESLISGVHGNNDSPWNDAAEFLLQAVGGVSRQEIRDGSLVMFDNIIKTYRMTEIDHLEYGVLITIVRDPRSTYVALYNESVKFRPDVDAFIRSYRAKRQRTDREYEKVVHSDRVVQVQFEDFVTSEEYRRVMVQRLGLAPDDRDVHTYFRPWESARNTRNFVDFPDQSAIRAIEKALPEYLWKPPPTG